MKPDPRREAKRIIFQINSSTNFLTSSIKNYVLSVLNCEGIQFSELILLLIVLYSFPIENYFRTRFTFRAKNFLAYTISNCCGDRKGVPRGFQKCIFKKNPYRVFEILAHSAIFQGFNE
jgi:hypothetical protein